MCGTEIFSYAELPWPGVPDAKLMRHIQQRDKMAQPAACPDQLYEVMCACWRLDRHARITTIDAHAAIVQYCQHSSMHARIIQYTWPTLAVLQQQQQQQQQHAPSTDTQLHAVDVQSQVALQRFAQLELQPADIALQRELGSGAFGSVQLAVLTVADRPPQRVAVKLLKQGSDAETVSKFKQEAMLLAAVQHQHIVQLVGVVSTQQPMQMVMELMSGGDLQKYLRARDGRGTLERLAVHALSDVCRQVGSAMAYLARVRVVHRDLAARCVVLIVLIYWFVLSVTVRINCASAVWLILLFHACVCLQERACQQRGPQLRQAQRPGPVAHSQHVTVLPQDKQRQGQCGSVHACISAVVV